MKLAVFSDNFYPEISGISDSIRTLAVELSARGHETDFYVPAYGAKDYARANVVAHNPFENNPLITVRRMWSLPYSKGPTGQSRVVIPTWLRWLGMRGRSYDLVHTHLFFGVGFEALAAAHFLHLPLVGTSHTPISEFLEYSPMRSKAFTQWSIRKVSWFYNKCDFVTAPSASVFTEMNANGFVRPHKVISNPIDLRSFTPVNSSEKQERKKEFGFSDATILYAGRLAPEKHIDVIMRAVALVKEKIPDARFVLTGHGSAEAELRALAHELGIADRVRFMGMVEKEMFTRVYQASDVFVIMSTAETQSIALMQAMASGIPVIGARARALPEYINEHSGYCVEPGDYRELAERLTHVLSDSAARERFGRGAVERVQNYSIHSIATQWEEVYRGVLGGNIEETK